MRHIRYFCLIVYALCAICAHAASSVSQTIESGTTSLAIVPSNAGDVLLILVKSNGGGGSPYLTSISDSQSLTWTSVLGTFGGTSAYWLDTTGGRYYQAYWAVATATTSDMVTIAFNGGTPSGLFFQVADCVGVVTTAPILTNIYNYQASPGTGANAITTSGGTGSDNVGTAPALLVGAVWATAGTISVGTGWTLSLDGTGTYRLVEYQRVTSTGTYDATATNSSASLAASWMIAFKEAASTGPPPSQFFLGDASARRGLIRVRNQVLLRVPHPDAIIRHERLKPLQAHDLIGR